VCGSRVDHECAAVRGRSARTLPDGDMRYVTGARFGAGRGEATVGLRSDGRDRQPRQVLLSVDAKPGRSDELMIDLGADVVERERPRSRLRHLTRARVPVVALLLALVAGVGVGGAITYQWQAHQRRLADESAVSLLVLANPCCPTVVADDVAPLSYRDRITVVNTGPMPVDVSAPLAKLNGFYLQGAEAEQHVKAGVAEQVEIELSVDCMIGVPSEAFPISLTVRTADGVTHQASYLVDLSGTRLADLIGTNCPNIHLPTGVIFDPSGTDVPTTPGG
jgi:hypothetical protein